MYESERYKTALEEINNKSFNTGRADLLGLEIKEIVRRAFHPDKPCPQCKGAGEVPSTNRDCGICRNYDSQTMGFGKCEKGVKKGWVDECSSICEQFDDLSPMQTCSSCKGKKMIKDDSIDDDIADRFEILDM